MCAEHRTEVLERVNLLQWLTIMQDDLALTTRDDYWHYLGLGTVNWHAACGVVVVTNFKQALHFPVVAHEHKRDQIHGLSYQPESLGSLTRIDKESIR